MEVAAYFLDDFSANDQSFCCNQDDEDDSLPLSSPQSSSSKLPSPKSSSSPSISSSTSRRKFTEEEDKLLSKLVSEMGPRKWDQIAKNMPNNRTARQCRDRYSNYLIPGFFNGEWSKEEDELLYKKYQEYGPKWAVIKEFFTNRSPNAIKNRWNYFVSRSSTIASTVNAEKNVCGKQIIDAGKQNYIFATNDKMFMNDSNARIISPPTVIHPNASAPMFQIWAGHNFIPQQQLSPVQAEIFTNGYSTFYNNVRCGYFQPNPTKSIQLTVQNSNLQCQIPQNYQIVQNNNNFNNYNRCNMAFCNNFAVKPTVVPQTESVSFEQTSSVSSSPIQSDLEDQNGAWEVDDDQASLFDNIDADAIANDDELKLNGFCYLDANENDIFSFY